MLRQNCVVEDPRATCAVGNVASAVSTVMWFGVLLPQLVHNQSRRSVAGLNPLWALANFTASLSNLLFVFSIALPLQVRVMAVYMPALESLMLAQFWWWYDWNGSKTCFSNCPNGGGDDDARDVEDININLNINAGDEPCGADVSAARCCGSSCGAHTHRVLVAAACALCWTLVISIQCAFPPAKAYFAWGAIALWSVESFPQLWTNVADPHASVGGQSALSIAITCIGKTTDGLAAYLLQMPHQTHVLAYFSGTSAWINALHVFVLYNGTSVRQAPTGRVERGVAPALTVVCDQLVEASSDEEARSLHSPTSGAATAAPGSTLRCSRCIAVPRCNRCIVVPSRVEAEIRAALRRSCCLRAVVGGALSLLVVTVLCGAVWRIWQWWAILLPVSTLGVVLAIHLLAIR